MDSSRIPNNYINNPSVMYPAQMIELATEKVTYDNNIGKFIPLYMTPSSGTEVYERTLPKNSTSNIVNKSNNLGLSKITVSNYLELTVPKYLFTIKDIQITPNATFGEDGYYVSCAPKAKIIYNEYLKGQKFLLIHLGGDINKPYIIGVV